MKKYLLDTHTFIWAVLDDDKLSRPVLNLFQDNNCPLFVSAVSFWEMSIKQGKGKLNFENFHIQHLFDYCKRLGVKPISLPPEEAINYSKLSFIESHKDPFDRMLICQCIANGYVLVSRDARMAEYKTNGLECVW